MDYQKITLTINPDQQEFREIMMASLANIGFESFSEEDCSFDAYIQASLFNNEDLVQLDFSPLFEYEWKSEFIPDQDWNEEWEKQYFKPLLIADRCLIRAPFHTDCPKTDYEIVIDPKMAFGTGNHETTSLVIQYILENDFKDKQVLDMGCGTGILSILASLRGAKEIVSIDIDKWSYENTLENSEINHCHNIVALCGDASLLSGQRVDWVFANIHKNILIADMPKYASIMVDGASIILSGFYLADLDDINVSAQAQGLTLKNYKTENDWVAALFTK